MVCGDMLFATVPGVGMEKQLCPVWAGKNDTVLVVSKGSKTLKLVLQKIKSKCAAGFVWNKNGKTWYHHGTEEVLQMSFISL